MNLKQLVASGVVLLLSGLPALAQKRPSPAHPFTNHPSTVHNVPVHPSTNHPGVVHLSVAHPSVVHVIPVHPFTNHPSVDHPGLTHLGLNHSYAGGVYQFGYFGGDSAPSSASSGVSSTGIYRGTTFRYGFPGLGN